MPLVKKSVSTTLSNERDAVENERILELQKKIQDENYLNNAIDRIAIVISRNLVESKIHCLR